MSDQVLEYVSRLLNKSVTIDTELSLSSAQMVRLHAWLCGKKIQFNESALSKRFTLASLLKINVSSGISIAQSLEKLKINSQKSEIRHSIGIDIQSVDELFPNGMPVDPKADSELIGIFTVAELSYAQSKENPLETLTGIFSIKEAVKKACEHPINLLDVEVSWNKDGAPIVSGYAISISHSRNYAVGIALRDDLNNSVAKLIEPSHEKKNNSFFAHIVSLYFLFFIALSTTAYALMR
jgi:phosphopantetheinyl transferase (holo-ACP synthase)